MSVQAPIYIMWGLMLPYPKPLEDDDANDVRFDAYRDSAFDKAPREGVTVLLDGMGGKYVAVGVVIARSGPYGDDLGTHAIPFPPVPGLPAEDMARYARWRQEIDEALKATQLDIAALGLSFGWHVIQHYR